MNDPITSAKRRLAFLHHEFYPHTSAEEFYKNLLADIFHYEDTLEMLGVNRDTFKTLHDEAMHIYTLDYEVSADMGARGDTLQ